MPKGKRILLSILAHLMMSASLTTKAQTDADSLFMEHELDAFIIEATSGPRMDTKVESVDYIGQSELIRAACCNLGESFTTNPSVDVSYSDAATGARQIKLLGLSGTYVQMLTENVPNLRGASLPFSLGFVPAPWMQSIQVSKGASSVKNGYESTTGQINIEYRKPQSTDGIRGNAYLDSDLKQELNADGNIHINDKLSTSLLLHLENRQMDHDGNKDGFMDMPKIKQYNLMHRWAYISSKLISQMSMKVLGDDRTGGQSVGHHAVTTMPYRTSTRTNRYEVQWKNGLTLNADHNTSVALMLHGSWHDAWNTFGNSRYDVTQRNSYAQLMFETDFNKMHSLAAGLSLNHDRYDERTSATLPQIGKDNETTGGIYAQYTYKLRDLLTIMPGIRCDRSDTYGTFVTPRLHVKYSPKDVLTLRASAGKGYRSPHALAENTTLLASGRTVTVDPEISQEEAWNMGMSADLKIPIKGKTLEVNAEYYYTNFISQMVINYGMVDGVHTLSFENLDGDSYSHTVQVNATYPILKKLSATAAFRLNDVRCTYDGTLRVKPLTSRYKGLLTLTYKTRTELWQFDATGQMNGGGELYDRTKFPAYFQLQAQVTREFRHFSVYLGGENLTNYKIKKPIVNAINPWSNSFDATQIWGPVTGAMAYIGLRFKFEKS